MIPKVLDLFSGIGGFALAFEAAGFETHAFAEIEPYPCKILAQNWPDVPNLGDVRGINGEDFRGAIDVVCGGFPCQDISTAGKGAGIHGARSGLWFEMLRIIRGSRPAFCLLENVPALRIRGARQVLDGLEESGYSGRAFVVGAWAAGAPHRRDRVWVVAYANGTGREPSRQPKSEYDQPFEGGAAMADAGGKGLEVRDWAQRERPHPAIAGGGWWATEPTLGRVAHGIPNRAHRIKALGNSIVPAVAYPFACWIKTQLEANP